MYHPSEYHRGVTQPKGAVEFAFQRRGERATRGAFTRALASRAIPTASNSLTPCGKSVAVLFTSSTSGSGARLTTNCPVASTLRSESLRPTDVNCTMGGVTDEIVKNECGARLSTPSAETVETQAMGRGTTVDVSSR